MRREGRSSFGEEKKSVGGCYTSVSDVLNTVSKGRRSILAPRSITRAVKGATHALTTIFSCARPLLLKYSANIAFGERHAEAENLPCKGELLEVCSEIRELNVYFFFLKDV